MPRPKALVPSLRAHICGQSVCEIGGTMYYLGPTGSPESLARYAVLVREYQQNGLSVPPHITSESLRAMTAGFAVPVEKISQADEPIQVTHVVEAYRQHILVRYKDSTSEKNRLLQVCRILESEAGSVEVDKFGPRILQKMRSDWIESGKSRQYCNRLTNSVVRLFKWATSQELADISTYQRLRTLEPLRVGESKAHETQPVEAANLEHVRATAKYLPPQLRAVIRIQVATGARPSEVLMMTPGQIDRSREEWIYRPVAHKNSKRGKRRAIPLIGDAREAVIDYLNRDPDSYLFSPKEALEWHNAQKRAARKTKVPPSQIDRSKPDASRVPHDHYNKCSYNRAIRRACEKAGVPHWTPYRLRHLAACVVREALGAEAAQALLGHSNLKMTEHYAKISEGKAVEAARHAPSL